MSKILFLFNSPPYDGPRCKDGIDASLVASAFGQEVSILFLSDAIYQLIPAQSGVSLGGKSIDKLIKAFDLYDIKKIFVEKSALEARNINSSTLIVETELLEPQQIQSQMQQHDVILSF